VEGTSNASLFEREIERERGREIGRERRRD